MNLLLKEIRHNRLLWLLVFVPAVFMAEHFTPVAHTMLFVLSVLAAGPLREKRLTDGVFPWIEDVSPLFEAFGAKTTVYAAPRDTIGAPAGVSHRVKLRKQGESRTTWTMPRSSRSRRR